MDPVGNLNVVTMHPLEVIQLRVAPGKNVTSQIYLLGYIDVIVNAVIIYCK